MAKVRKVTLKKRNTVAKHVNESKIIPSIQSLKNHGVADHVIADMHQCRRSKISGGNNFSKKEIFVVKNGKYPQKKKRIPWLKFNQRNFVHYQRLYKHFFYIRVCISMLHCGPEAREKAIKRLTTYSKKSPITKSPLLHIFFERPSITTGRLHDGHFNYYENIIRAFDKTTRSLFLACHLMTNERHVIATVIITRILYITGTNCMAFLAKLRQDGISLLCNEELLKKWCPKKVPITDGHQAYAPLGKDATNYLQTCHDILDNVFAFLKSDQKIRYVPEFFQRITNRSIAASDIQFGIMQIYMDLWHLIPAPSRVALRRNASAFCSPGPGCFCPNLSSLQLLKKSVNRDTRIKEMLAEFNIRFRSFWVFQIQTGDCSVRKAINPFGSLEAFALRKTNITREMINLRYPVNPGKTSEYTFILNILQERS